MNEEPTPTAPPSNLATERSIACVILVLAGVFALITATAMYERWPTPVGSFFFTIGAILVTYPLMRLAVAASGRKYPGHKW